VKKAEGPREGERERGGEGRVSYSKLLTHQKKRFILGRGFALLFKETRIFMIDKYGNLPLSTLNSLSLDAELL